MQLIRRFSEKEVLEIVVRHAVEEIPGESKGKVHAKYTDNNEVEIYFMPNDKNKPDELPS